MLSRHQGWEPHATPTGTVVPFRAHKRIADASVAARRDDDAPAAGARSSRPSSSQPSRPVLLTEEQLRATETAHPDGLTAVQVVDAFTKNNIKFSEASFRKYVQQGLLPRSKRVGRKGKHKGSLGLYPAKTVRRINTVKDLMDQGYTIEEIQGQFLHYTDLIEGVAEHLTELFVRIDRDHEKLDATARRELKTDLADARRESDRLVERLQDITRRVAAPRTDTLRLAGAAGGAEDLL